MIVYNGNILTMSVGAFLEIKSKLVSHDLIGLEVVDIDQLFSIKVNSSEDCEFILPTNEPTGDHVGNEHDFIDQDSAYEAFEDAPDNSDLGTAISEKFI